jgi:hypothetical protein
MSEPGQVYIVEGEDSRAYGVYLKRETAQTRLDSLKKEFGNYFWVVCYPIGDLDPC